MQRYLKFLAAAVTLAAAGTGANAAAIGQPAPEFAGINQWLNSEPLTMQQLRGKVVLVDFWTYDCINCINTLSHVVQWHDKYKDKGLVVVGVHTPEYAFERKTDNVRAALKRFDIRYPVAQDNRYATWNAYGNRYWPAFYLVNKKGQVVYTHFGEGRYEQTEAKIQQLLAQSE
jgi:thiol-disulfide isomerase/thioredoxin